MLAKIGRPAVRWSRPAEGRQHQDRHGPQRDEWLVHRVLVFGAAVPTLPLPSTGRETGLDVGLITADGEAVVKPRHSRQAEQQLAKA